MKEGKTPPREERADPLLGRIDAALAEWPATSEGTDRTDETLAQVASRKTPRSMPALSDDEIVRAPLPESEADRLGGVDPGTATASAPAPRGERPPTDFAELVRFAATGGASRAAPGAGAAKADAESAKDENSGVVDLRAIGAGAGAGSSPEAPSTSGPALGTPPAAPPDKDRRPQPGRRRAAAWLALTGVIAASAALGGVFFGMKRVSERDAESSASTASVGSTHRGPAAATTAAARAAPADGYDTTPISPASSGVTPGLPPPRAELAPPAKPSSKTGAPIASGATPSAGHAAGDRAIVPARAPSNSSRGETDLSALMQQAVGGTSPRPAAGGSSPRLSDTSAAEGVPLKPAFGAVQGAVGTALPAARACLGPDDPIARATMTFRSDGSVQNVTVAGDAAGKPAEACIRRALLAARLPPFAAPTFTWTTTVRPP